MSRKLVLLISLILLSQAFLVLPARSNPEQFPPAAVVGRYVLYEDRYWIVNNKTVQQLRNEGFDLSGDADWLLQVNYTRLGYTAKSKIVGLSWPNATLHFIEGAHHLNVTAHRIMEDGSIGEKIGSFLKTNRPPYAHPSTFESEDPNFGIVFNPSAFTIGNTFSTGILTYTVNRTETLTGTLWGQNQTFVLNGYFANASHCYKWTAWCDAESGIELKQIVDSKTPMHTSYEEMKTVETGVECDKFDVVQNGQSYQVQVDTNSTLSNFEFDSNANKISLTVNGPTGTQGMCNITVPKNLMPTGHTLEVYIDGKKTDYHLTEDADNYYVCFEYLHSAHIVTINFVASVIWTQWWFWLVAGAGIIVLAGAVVYFLRKRKPSTIAASPSLESTSPPSK